MMKIENYYHAFNLNRFELFCALSRDKTLKNTEKTYSDFCLCKIGLDMCYIRKFSLVAFLDIREAMAIILSCKADAYPPAVIINSILTDSPPSLYYVI